MLSFFQVRKKKPPYRDLNILLTCGFLFLFVELLLAPFVPSNTARGGGIVLPVVQSIATTLGSTPSHQPKVGGFLMLVGAHANLLSASMFLTGMAPNPIVIAKANALYPELQFNFMTWIQGSCVPALFCAATLPLILSWSCGLYKSKTSDEEESQQLKIDGESIVQHAAKELREMGTLSIKELVTKKKKNTYIILVINLFCFSNSVLYFFFVLFYGSLRVIQI